MKFIIPQNYNFRNKLFGLIDYSTAIFNIIWLLFVFFCLNLFPISLKIKISIFISLYFPIFLFSIIGFHNENIIYVMYYLCKFVKNRKVYFFNKD